MDVDESTIGRTPLIRLDLPVDATVYAKVEWFNLHATPYGGGSVKSRIAKGMLDAAEAAGDLDGRTIIEPTSGNTGSELAKVGGARGHDVEVVMPDNASDGKVRSVQEAGGTIHFVDAARGYDAVLDRCEEIMGEAPDRYYRPNQYTNPENPGAHERTTAPEIWNQTNGTVTHVVAGVGTGGTVTGTGRGLDARGDVTVVGFEPANALHAIDGLKFLRSGEHYHPETYDESIVDEKVYVETGDAYERARTLKDRYADRVVPITDPGRYDQSFVRERLRVDLGARREFLVGTSSGAAIQAVHGLDARGTIDSDSVVVVVFADRGDKYADIPLWEHVF